MWTRRQFLLRAVNLIEVAATSAFWVWKVEPGLIRLRHLEIPIEDLPPAFDGLKLAHLSDLHTDTGFPAESFRLLLPALHAQKPDLILFTGDYVTRSCPPFFRLAEEMKALQPSIGAFASLGNHDHWTTPDLIADALEQYGVHVLRNRSVPLEKGGSRMWLGGLDDIWMQKHDLPRCLAGIPKTEKVILLAHEPDYGDIAASDPRIALQLSGHSHGGQVWLPFYGPPLLPPLGRKYPYGLQRLGGMWLYTTSGLGMVPPRVRFNCPPEVAFLTLRRVNRLS